MQDYEDDLYDHNLSITSGHLTFYLSVYGENNENISN